MLVPRGIKWDKSADVVVIGFGLAGAAAAITARDKGASVILLEKQKADGICSCSSISGGLYLCPTDADDAAKYMNALCRVKRGLSWTDRDIIDVWARYTAQNQDWVAGLGGNAKFFAKAAEYPELPGSDSIGLWSYQGNGLRMMDFMYGLAESKRIEVLWQTPGHLLYTNRDGAVIGVRATDISGGRPVRVNIKASKAVVITTGGFEESEEMKLQYLRMYPVYFAGGQSNTGDGIKMALDVGADLWHMNCCSARLMAKFPDFPVGFLVDFGGGGWSRRQILGSTEEEKCGFIIVDKYGRRYTSENIKLHAAFYELTDYDTHRREYPKVPSYYICDQRRMELGGSLGQRSSGPSGPHQLYKWSLDNKAEIEKGWIITADSLEELAGKIGVPVTNLRRTVEKWNNYCAKGKDPEFGRKPLDLVPLDEPPFYSIRLYPGGPNTQGGPRRNSKAQILNPFGKVIPGLYGAGECGSIYGMLYPIAGGNLAECIAFGRIAGENAVQENARQ
ncbi:MAG: FAD-binding protein [Chloroflexi bacterium]|nr:FAD-binding protein [Chloroflexota bacterium]